MIPVHKHCGEYSPVHRHQRAWSNSLGPGSQNLPQVLLFSLDHIITIRSGGISVEITLRCGAMPSTGFHVDIHQDHIRLKQPGLVNSLFTIGCFPHHFNITDERKGAENEETLSGGAESSANRTRNQVDPQVLTSPLPISRTPKLQIVRRGSFPLRIWGVTKSTSWV